MKCLILFSIVLFAGLTFVINQEKIAGKYRMVMVEYAGLDRPNRSNLRLEGLLNDDMYNPPPRKKKPKPKAPVKQKPKPKAPVKQQRKKAKYIAQDGYEVRIISTDRRYTHGVKKRKKQDVNYFLDSYKQISATFEWVEVFTDKRTELYASVPEKNIFVYMPSHKDNLKLYATKMYSNALKDPKRPILLFEDDVDLSIHIKEKLDFAVKELHARNIDNYIIDCSNIENHGMTKFVKDLHKVKYVYGTVCMLYSIPAAKKVYEYLQQQTDMNWNTGYDHYIGSLKIPTFAFEKSLVQHMGKQTTGLAGIPYPKSRTFEKRAKGGKRARTIKANASSLKKLPSVKHNEINPSSWISPEGSFAPTATSKQQWRLFFSEKNDHWSKSGGKIVWNKLISKEKIVTVKQEQIGVNNYFNILTYQNKMYLYSRCDCKSKHHGSEQGNCVCVQTSEDNFVSKRYIDSSEFVLAFYTFIDTNPSTPESQRFKAVYGVRERNGSGDWWAAYSADGITFTKAKIIWNRQKFISSRGGAYAFDSLNTIYFDNDRKEYVAYARYVKDWKKRTVMTSTTKNFLSWPYRNWKVLQFSPTLSTSLYLMNAEKCLLPQCPYVVGFNTIYNGNLISPDCRKHKVGKMASANCEDGHQDIAFSISSDTTRFYRAEFFNVFEKEFGDHFPRNIWTVAGGLVNYEKFEISYFILHDGMFPTSFIRRYTIPIYRYSSLTCGNDPCVVKLKSTKVNNIEDIKINARTDSIHGKISYQLTFLKNGQPLDKTKQKCKYVDSAEFYGDEFQYSIRFGYQRWEVLLDKKAATHATGGLTHIFDWYKNHKKTEYPIKMPTKGMTYKDCLREVNGNADEVQFELKIKHASLFSVYWV